MDFYVTQRGKCPACSGIGTKVNPVWARANDRFLAENPPPPQGTPEHANWCDLHLKSTWGIPSRLCCDTCQGSGTLERDVTLAAAVAELRRTGLL